MATFDFEVDVDVRFRDLDAMGHVNNAVYGTYLETGRLAYLDEVAGDTPEGSGLTIANLEIDFQRPIRGEDAVTVAVRATEVGTSSIPLEYEVRTIDGVVATGRTTLVHVYGETGKPTPLPEDWRRRVEAHEGL